MTFVGCCASAVTATASSITAVRIVKRAPAPFVSRLITQAVIPKTIIYDRSGTRFIEEKRVIST